MTMKLAISGAAGRMGKRLITLGSSDSSFDIKAAWDMEGHPLQGQDAGTVAGISALNVPISVLKEDTEPVDVVIDFSTPAAFDSLLAWCLKTKSGLVYATTGLAPEKLVLLQNAGQQIPVLWSPSMSMTVNLTMKLAQMAAKALADKDADVEILERHHRFKVDAPSGTALKFGQIISKEMGIENSIFGREGKVGARPHNEIGYHAIRIGDNPGEHSIIFGLLGETIELTVKATNRDAYATGALLAAKFLQGKPAGFYSMDDVLFLNE